MTVCAVLVGGFEGCYTKAYHDNLAHGLPTVCYGETEGVKMGDHYTPDQCAEMLANKLPRYWSEIEPNITVATSDNEKIAFTSFSYNVGTGAFNSSRALKLLNEGKHAEACHALLPYNHASGKYVPGLARRRHAEEKVCLSNGDFDATMALARSFNEPLPRGEPAPKKRPAPKPVCTPSLFRRCE
jgi:lysozyme